MALILVICYPVSFGRFLELCVVALVGNFLYELKNKFLPCSKCTNKVPEYEIEG